MRKLEDLNIAEKINELESLIAKAELNIDYKIQVALGDEGDAMISKMKTDISNARNLFGPSGRLEQLDYDVKAAAYANYQTLLDSYLKKFPEYAMNDVITESFHK